jgi:GT2 family glycosyltransferase
MENSEAAEVQSVVKLSSEFGDYHSLSAVVVNYNAGAIIVDCVRLALQQCNEVVVVDNASTDMSLSLLEQAFPIDNGLLVVRNSKNLGFAVACNIGASHATSTHLLFLNPDCLLDSGAAARLMDALEFETGAAMVGGLLINPDGTEQAGGRRAVPTPWRSFVRGFGFSRFANRWPKLFFDFRLHMQPLPALPVEVEAISGACMLLRATTLQGVGSWDEGYFLHCEDLDLCIRLTRAGHKIFFVPNASVIHYKGTCSRTRPVFVEWHKHGGMVRFYRKFFRHQYPGVLMGLVYVGVWLRFGLVVMQYWSKHIGRKLGRSE